MKCTNPQPKFHEEVKSIREEKSELKRKAFVQFSPDKLVNTRAAFEAQCGINAKDV